MPSDATPQPTDSPTPPNVDRVFADDSEPVRDFRFNKTVAAAFDDMVGRSVPYYAEIQRITAEIAADFAVPGSNLYDLGCSTGTTMKLMDETVDPDVRMVGIDNSDDMLDQAKKKHEEITKRRRVDFVNADFHEGLLIENASVVTMLFTLQFVRPLYRERLLQLIFDGMRDDGVLLLAEKTTSEHTLLNRLFIKYYYNYKKRVGYSETEIARKREALENVLIPYRYEENVELLKKVGFRHVEESFRWYNFCLMVAVK
jgi:tRNA (cmo5U34)-methyltransferase